MTFDEIIEACQNRTRALNLQEFPVEVAINETYRRLHADFLFDETYVSESFTWAVADGAAKDMSSTLTGWREAPNYISSDSDSSEWQRVDIFQIYDRRHEGSTTNSSGDLVYATRGNYIEIVNAPSTALSVTIKHFKQPVDLSSLTDVPLMPVRYHYALVEGACADLFGFSRQMSEGRLNQKQIGPDEGLARMRYEEAVKKIRRDRTDERRMRRQITPDPLWQGFMSNQNRRRG